MDHFKKIGILGGGQLGRMLALAAGPHDQSMAFLDKSSDYPASTFASTFVQGDFNNYNDVYSFGQSVDVLSIEIEHVNTDAMRACLNHHIEVYPHPDTLDLIKDKWLQYCFYRQHNIPTASALLVANKTELLNKLNNKEVSYPFVQKTRSQGYDGKGVAIISSSAEHELIMDTPSMIQDKINIKQEIAVIIAKHVDGSLKHYEPVEMVFDPMANLLDMLVCPARLPDIIRNASIEIATDVANKLDIVGLLAVELFLDDQNNLIVNEVAPRPHNSGHHTIENCVTSQYQQLNRILGGYPLGSTRMKSPAVMINLLGHPDYTGAATIQGMEHALNQEDIYVHLYGKRTTKPYRKMGHITILSDDLNQAIKTAQFLKETIKIVSI